MVDDKTRDRLTTVLDPLRPAVVVRRRVYEVATVETTAPRVFSTTTTPSPGFVEDDESDNGPPSSINVARALASLRADELQRVEDLMRADDADEAARSVEEAAPPPAAAARTLLVGEKVALIELARQMGIPPKELAATLVARGFYSITAKTVLNRETAQSVGEMFGWQVDVAPESDPPEASTKRAIAKTKKPKAASRKP